MGWRNYLRQFLRDVRSQKLRAALTLFGLIWGTTSVTHLGPGADVAATVACLRAMGVTIGLDGRGGRQVHGRGRRSLQAPAGRLDAANSGTTMRLLAGVVAACPFTTVLTGDDSLRTRPMERVAEPLRRMGASLQAADGHAPLEVRGGPLVGIRHVASVPSAQVKSALLLAGLFADGETAVEEPAPTRDHTERMLRAMGAAIEAGEGGLRVSPLCSTARQLLSASPSSQSGSLRLT